MGDVNSNPGHYDILNKRIDMLENSISQRFERVEKEQENQNKLYQTMVELVTEVKYLRQDSNKTSVDLEKMGKDVMRIDTRLTNVENQTPEPSRSRKILDSALSTVAGGLLLAIAWFVIQGISAAH